MTMTIAAAHAIPREVLQPKAHDITPAWVSTHYGRNAMPSEMLTKPSGTVRYKTLGKKTNNNNLKQNLNSKVVANIPD